MRIILSVFVIFGVLHSNNSNLLTCSFDDKTMNPYCDCPIYGCYATKVRIPFEDKTFDGYTGYHLYNKHTVDVNFLSISNSVANYLPRRLDLIFNLTGLTVEGTSLLKIRSKAFVGLEQLQYLNLRNNYLTVIPYDGLYRLSQLKTLILQNNHIQELSSKVFRKNLKLERILLNNNHLKFIGPETFKNLKQLIFVELRFNKCLSYFYIGINSIQNLNIEIAFYCENEIESIPEKINQLRKKIRKYRKKNRVLLESTKEPCVFSKLHLK